MKFSLRFSLANYYLANRDCFDTLQLPANYNKDVFIATVLQECGAFGIAQGLINFQQQVELWGIRRKYNLEGIMESTMQKYNMVENYDRIEEWSETGSGQTVTDSSGTSDTTSSADNKSAGYDSSDLKTDGTSSATGSTETGNHIDGTSNDSRQHTGRIHGNIGVLTAAQMLEAERNLHNYDPYLEAARIFAHDLLIPMYL